MSAVLPVPSTDDAPPGGTGAPAADAELFIVMNQGSGSAEKDEVRKAIEAELMAATRRHRFVPVQPGQIQQACQDAARQAREHGGILVAAGGDGTINSAAQAALAHDCPLGVIAQGTFNLFARQNGLPLDAGEATRALLHASPEPVQVGLVNQRVFLVNASLGLYPKLLADREEVKQKLGRKRWIAMLAALKSLMQWQLLLRLDVEIDGELRQLRTTSVFLCNNRLQLERVGAPADVLDQLDEGRLACVVVRPVGWWDKLRMVPAAFFGRLSDERAIDVLPLRSLNVAVRNARRLKVAFDGEVQWMELPLHFTVAPRPLRLMLPPVEERLPPQ